MKRMSFSQKLSVFSIQKKSFTCNSNFMALVLCCNKYIEAGTRCTIFCIRQFFFIFPWTKSLVFCFKYHWSMSLIHNLQQLGNDSCDSLAPEQVTIYCLNQCWFCLVAQWIHLRYIDFSVNTLMFLFISYLSSWNVTDRWKKTSSWKIKV